MRVNIDRRVYAIFGGDPELMAYAMAKYSRSSLSLRESVAELSQQKAEKFLNTYYFQYGHRSIADLAHVCLALENISMLAAMEVVDEAKWDGQERSTRYQDFRETGYYVPNALVSTKHERPYRRLVEHLFDEYYWLVNRLESFLRSILSRPAEISEGSYDRTIRARAFDSARYLLPLCTVTSVGQIVSARVLEDQIARLKSHHLEEVREIGELLKRASCEPAFDINRLSLEKALSSVNGLLGRDDKARVADSIIREVRVAPTLIRYSESRPYLVESYKELEALVGELFNGVKMMETSHSVELTEEEDLQSETVNTLLYRVSDLPYNQIKGHTSNMSQSEKREIIGLVHKHRSKHDEVIRELRSGYALKFDILMDIGGFRDLQRHRRCIKVCQGITPLHGFEIPDDVRAAGVLRRYQTSFHKVLAVYSQIAEDFPDSAKYVLPMAFRRRALFKMDLAEAQYICELRTAPQGHSSYQAVAYHMFLRLHERYPDVAKFIRVHESWFESDRLRR